MKGNIHRLSGVEESGIQCGWMQAFIHVRGIIIEFQMVTSTGTVFDPLSQVIVMNTFTASPGQPWSECVVDGFDLDICQGVA